MISRISLALVLTFSSSAKAWCCSCSLWGGETVSDLYSDGNYVSLWVVPTNAAMKEQKSGWERFLIVYELRVLESFNQIQDKSITAKSSVKDGASCGIQLDLGTPQFLTLRRAADSTFRASICNPELPYSLVKTYLSIGTDSPLMGVEECSNESGNLKKPAACSVWEEHYQSNRNGNEDTLKYIERLRNEPKKKRRWWHF